MDNPVLLQRGLWKGLSRSTLHLWVLVVVLSVWPRPQLQLTQFCLFSGKFRCNRLDYLKKKKKSIAVSVWVFKIPRATIPAEQQLGWQKPGGYGKVPGERATDVQ